MAERPNDSWALGAQYADYVGRWSRRVAIEFLRWLERSPNLDWADIGCGTGALSSAVLEQAQPRRVRSVDASAGCIAHARSNTTDVRVSFEVADACALPLADGEVDVAVSGLVLNFVPEPAAAVREMARIVRSGGTVAAYVWDYAGKMELMRYFWDAAVALSPSAADLDE